MYSNPEGCFFVLDGPDGSGKTTQMRMLAQSLPALYPERRFVFTREPGGSPFAEDIRALILSEIAKDAGGAVLSQLFGAARFEHLERVVMPRLMSGEVVICDRFDGSTYAYQVKAQGGGVAAQRFFMLQRELIRSYFLTCGWTTLLFDLDAERAMPRAQHRFEQKKTHFDDRDKAFYDGVREGFEAYARDYPSGIIRIDAGRTVGEVHEDVLAVFKKAFG